MSGELRNRPCWCGSAKKYKKCHLPLEQSEKARSHEVEGQLRSKLKIETCEAPAALKADCSKEIVGAHTISRSAALSRISRDGHVYSTSPSFKELTKNKGVLKPTLIGVRRMSTFNGFCSKHDTELFRSLDDPNAQLDAVFCTQLAFRSVSKELFLKRELPNSDSDIRLLEKGGSMGRQQEIRAMLTWQQAGMAAALRDLRELKDGLDDAIATGDVSGWSHLVVRLAGQAPLVLSSVFQPTYLPDGKQIQNLADIQTPAESVFFGAVPVTGGIALILTWRKSDLIAESFVRAVERLGPDVLPSYLIGLAFEMCENTAISPDWWDRLPTKWKEELTASINRGVSPFGEMSKESNPRRLDGMPTGCTFDRLEVIG